MCITTRALAFATAVNNRCGGEKITLLLQVYSSKAMYRLGFELGHREEVLLVFQRRLRKLLCTEAMFMAHRILKLDTHVGKYESRLVSKK